MKKTYQTNIEDLLEKIRKNTATTNLSAESLALDVSVDGLEGCCASTNTLLDAIKTLITAQNATLDGDEQQVDIVSGTVTANLSSVDNAVLDTIDAVLDEIKLDTEAIETAIELLDNAVDGNYLNVNANIAGTDFVGGAGAVASGVQRTTLASDDPAVAKLGEIDTAIDTIDGVLDSSLTKLTEIDTAIDTIDGVLDSSLTKLGEIETTNNANQVLLGTIDSDTSSLPGMATSLAALDNAVDGNFLNVNANIAGTDIVGGAGNVASGVQRVVLATNDVPTALINTNLATLETDVEATNTLLTAIKANQLLMLGESGAVTISGTTAVSESAGTYCAVNFIKASTPDPLTITGVTTIAEVEYPAGTWLYGDVTDITCDADALYILYKGNPA